MILSISLALALSGATGSTSATAIQSEECRPPQAVLERVRQWGAGWRLGSALHPTTDQELRRANGSTCGHIDEDDLIDFCSIITGPADVWRIGCFLSSVSGYEFEEIDSPWTENAATAKPEELSLTIVTTGSALSLAQGALHLILARDCLALGSRKRERYLYCFGGPLFFSLPLEE